MLQATLDGVTAAFYNAFFTSLPIGGFALFDRPLRRFTTLEEHPEAYNRKPPLTAGAFWKTGVATAVIHALVRLMQRAFLFAFHVIILHWRSFCKYRMIRARVSVPDGGAPYGEPALSRPSSTRWWLLKQKVHVLSKYSVCKGCMTAGAV